MIIVNDNTVVLTFIRRDVVQERPAHTLSRAEINILRVGSKNYDVYLRLLRNGNSQ